MPKHMVVLPRSSERALDIVSYGRRGPGGTLRLNPEQVEQVQRTVSRVPEVMVKISGGARDTGGARAHLKYIGRHGKLDLETDDGLSLQGKDAADHLVADWQLDLSRSQYKPKPPEGQKDTRAKLVHNIVLSMPAGTPPDKVLGAARLFARENFALQYRYAMVLHTDQAHPHVHLVVKCEHETEPGKRLYIRKDTLRQWREQFARLMREQGVPANATPRQLRGQSKAPLKDPIYRRLRAAQTFQHMPEADRTRRPAPPGSTFMRAKVTAIARALQAGQLLPDPGKGPLRATRDEVKADWAATREALRRQGQPQLAEQVERFVRSAPPARTDAEQIAAGLARAIKARESPPDERHQDRSR